MLVLLILEIIVIVNNSLFFDRGITKDLSGASPIINVYYALFLLGLIWQFGMAVEASYSKNTMQVLAIALFNLILVGFSGIRIEILTRNTAAANSAELRGRSSNSCMD